VVFSGDTRYSEAVVAAARGADVLVHEVISPDVERRRAKVKDPAAVERIIAHHTTPEEAGRIFAAAGPRLAVYSHIVPSPATARDLVEPTRRAWRGALEVGYDRMQITIGSRIEVRRRARVPE
jgi:ribonuclease Z